MRCGGNNFSYFSDNKLLKLANLLQFKPMLMSGFGGWGSGST